MIEAARVGAVVLAAGASSRFGSAKLLAPLEDRPVLQWVLDTLATVGLRETVVVLGHRAAEVERGVAWHDERRIVNPDPGRGMSSSLQLGLVALGPASEAALIALGDQPLVRAEVIACLMANLESEGPPIVAPRYASGGPNPLLVRRAAWSLANEATGDRGLGPLLARRPELVLEIPVDGENPDVDTPADLAEVASLASRPSASARARRPSNRA